MTRPIFNIADLAEFRQVGHNGQAIGATRPDQSYEARLGAISTQIGAQKLGYNLTVVPPGKRAFPRHSHRVNEEMFFIIEGEGELRFGDKRYPIRAHDVIACPPGGPDVAHQIVNTGKTTMRYLSLSTLAEVEACEYPDSNKVMVRAGRHRKERGLRKIFRAEGTVDYYDGEPLDNQG
jgi:uncharacterized cupin superfamily protein